MHEARCREFKTDKEELVILRTKQSLLRVTVDVIESQHLQAQCTVNF